MFVHIECVNVVTTTENKSQNKKAAIDAVFFLLKECENKKSIS